MLIFSKEELAVKSKVSILKGNHKKDKKYGMIKILFDIFMHLTGTWALFSDYGV
jgi:hypothetical protein